MKLLSLLLIVACGSLAWSTWSGEPSLASVPEAERRAYGELRATLAEIATMIEAEGPGALTTALEPRLHLDPVDGAGNTDALMFDELRASSNVGPHRFDLELSAGLTDALAWVRGERGDAYAEGSAARMRRVLKRGLSRRYLVVHRPRAEGARREVPVEGFVIDLVGPAIVARYQFSAAVDRASGQSLERSARGVAAAALESATGGRVTGP